MSFTEAARILSERYFGGEELLYPDVRRSLDATLGFLEGMRRSYLETLEMRPPESDEDFILWMDRDRSEKEQEASADDTTDDMPRPRVRRAAQAIAKHVILVARAEALDDLGERDAGIKLVQDWMRSDEGLQRLEDARDSDRNRLAVTAEVASPKDGLMAQRGAGRISVRRRSSPPALTRSPRGACGS